MPKVSEVTRISRTVRLEASQNPDVQKAREVVQRHTIAKKPPLTSIPSVVLEARLNSEKKTANVRVCTPNVPTQLMLETAAEIKELHTWLHQKAKEMGFEPLNTQPDRDADEDGEDEDDD